MPRHASLILCFAAALLGARADGAAQVGGARSPEQALAGFARVRERPEAQQLAALRELGRFAEPPVTAALLLALAHAQGHEFRLTAVQALSEQARPEALGAYAPLLEPGSDARLLTAAARGLGRLGDPGVAELEARLARQDLTGGEPRLRALRLALLAGLAQARTERSFALLVRESARGNDLDRLDALRHLAMVPESEAVVRAREQALAAKDLQLVAEALRQLATAGWPRTKEQALELHRRCAQGALLTVRQDLVGILARVLGPDTYEPFLEHLALAAPRLDAALQDPIARARTHAGFVAWLQSEGLGRRLPRERVAALRLLATVGDEKTVRLVVAQLQAKEDEVALAAIEVLAFRKAAAAVPALRELLRAPQPARRPAALLALHGLLAAEPAWRKELLAIVRQPDPHLRTLALDLLAEVQEAQALAFAHEDLAHKEWTVRAAAIDFCRAVRAVASVPRLIARLELETGRLQEDLLDTLQDLTGNRFLSRARWEQWWLEVQPKFELVPPPQARARPRKTARESATVTYYDIPLTSRAVSFVLDTSGSMEARIGTGKETRLDEARRQLRRVLEAMPEQSRFNLIFFASSVRALDKALVPADVAHKKLAQDALAALTARGATNVFDALERAFADPELDTIYLLTDGNPSAGKVRDPEAIVQEVARWCRTRRVRIHAISVGEDSRLLQRLAQVSGGQYNFVR